MATNLTQFSDESITTILATDHSETSVNFHENMASYDSIIFKPTQPADRHYVK